MAEEKKKKLRVYGWRGHRSECPPAANGGHQTREICAAPSRAAALRIAGNHKPAVSEICTTGNPFELAVARAHPGVVLWKPNNMRNNEPFYRADTGQIASTLTWKEHALFSGQYRWIADVGPKATPLKLTVTKSVGHNPVYYAMIYVGTTPLRGKDRKTLYEAQRDAVDIAHELVRDIDEGLVGA